MKSIGFTITDGWAYRFIFSTGLYNELKKTHKITLICSNYYYKLITSSYEDNIDIIECVKLDFNDKNRVFFKLISLLNYLYINIYDFNINKFYILKKKWLPRQFYKLFSSILKRFSSTKLIEHFFENFHIEKPKNIDKQFDVIYFLSPYLKNEIALAISYKKDQTELCFILPSWDNIYKYYTFKFFSSYFVWGESQKLFLKERLNIKAPIYVKGPISQYFFNKFKNISPKIVTNKSCNLLYATITSRNFPNELEFVKDLSKKIENDEYGINSTLLIRLHPAEKDVNFYKGLVSNKVSISYSKGVSSLYDWNVDENFFLQQSEDFIKSDIVITVASTITIDAILLDKPVINFKPKILNGKVDLYQFEHYQSITNSNELEIIESIEELNSVIKKILNGIHKNYRNSISKEVFLHDSSEISNYLEI